MKDANHEQRYMFFVFFRIVNSCVFVVKVYKQKREDMRKSQVSVCSLVLIKNYYEKNKQSNKIYK